MSNKFLNNVPLLKADKVQTSIYNNTKTKQKIYILIAKIIKK